MISLSVGVSDQVAHGAAHVRSVSCSGRRGDRLILYSGNQSFPEVTILPSPTVDYEL